MYKILSLIIVCLPGSAFAHTGHLGELAGHDHVIAGIALGVAVGVAIWGWLKGEKSEEVEGAEAEEAEA